MNVLVYTFRTFPHVAELQELFSDVVILGPLKKDILSLKEHLKEHQPRMILGVAYAPQGASRFEPVAINRFHTKGVVVPGGPRELSLHLPDTAQSVFVAASKPTDSFCNYSMYSVAEFLVEEGIEVPFAFVHIRREDISELASIMYEYQA